MKYVLVLSCGKICIITFPKEINHCDVVRGKHQHVVGAGFIDKKGKVSGMSESLKRRGLAYKSHWLDQYWINMPETGRWHFYPYTVAERYHAFKQRYSNA